MGLHPKFPKSPHEIIEPDYRWYPADETIREQGGLQYLLPPLVDSLRRKVKEWRDKEYIGATDTSKSLLKFWFETDHYILKSDGTYFKFKYYFAQREAIETIIYLHDVVKVKDKYDLIRFDSSKMVSSGHFEEDWIRLVVKMATGSGKTKVLSLAIVWSYFNKLYETESDLSRNFLLITPNIIVLDRLKTDFENLNIFREDPLIPENGFDGKDWQNDFHLTVHIQDNVNIINKTGNLFITNIHRVYDNKDKDPSFEDENTTEYFLGSKPITKTLENTIDLGDIVRDLDELLILNDEAHHVHKKEQEWFKSIQDINNKLLQKSSKLSLQIDVTATPKHDNGSIFVQTISDYPLVEAIYQNIVKQPLIPDEASRAKLSEKNTNKFSERYSDYLELGYIEWKKVYEEEIKNNKKAVLFIMTDDTRNCDEVSSYLESKYPDLKGSVLTIHTNNNGDISENSTGKSKEELEKLRKEANEIDFNKFKVIVSVLMLKEGWDVKNVTTIVGLRAFGGSNKNKNNILPEQTLGRGLRKMYREEGIQEYISVIGTEPFLNFVESIKNEGVELEKSAMGRNTTVKAPIIVEIDKENLKKDIDKLDIEIPILTPRINRDWKNLSELDIDKFIFKKIKIKNFTLEEQREIIFKNIISVDGQEEEIHHKTILDIDGNTDFSSIIGFFTQNIMKELRLVGGYNVLYPKIKNFIKFKLFENEVNLEDINIIRNLSETEVIRTIFECFRKGINELTIYDKGETEIKNYIKISRCRPFAPKEQAYLIPKKSVFNKIIGDSHFELEFASFLENCDDIISYTKNYLAVHFKIDYKNKDGEIHDYYPDFIVKKSDKEIYIIETKGLEDLDVPHKIERLKQWCEDINKIQNNIKWDFLYVDQKSFNRYGYSSFEDLIKNFNQYK
ncbi:MAG: DEAD/DEAH box helicase family protein [Candidatus ainarchaeum sp.]|nr:DEAD/DEAH box helicase family protein [Candidatus ainarchaeum sp.]